MTGAAVCAGGGIHDVAGSHSLTFQRSRCEHNECLPGVDGNSRPQLFAAVAHPVADRQGRAHRAFWIVLVGDGRAEQRHHRVADELLHRAAETLELPAQVLPIRREQRSHVLWIEPFCLRRKPNEVGEQHGDHLALLAPLLDRGNQRRSASVAEPRIGGVLVPASGAGRHTASLGKP